jgi:pSer/pThr/pTyr-binding forkhead associated (FHA) protein
LGAGISMEKELLKQSNGEHEVYLVVNNHIFPIDKEVITIGRKLENDLIIKDVLVSRKHAEIRFENDKYHIYDLNSTGGTFLNQKKVAKSILYSGDVILLANVPMMFIDDTAKRNSSP